eukprot:m.603517 g.603517  ORF g.603517 m.603517 type:complete len:517 (-) comp22455_c2_seq2:2446-3996(-)
MKITFIQVAIGLACIANILRADGGGTGCQKKLTKVCPNWESNEKDCLSCVKENLKKLEPECTQQKAEEKCTNPPTTPPPQPLPPALPPLPPVPPAPGAARPNVILFVVDDQGRANIGYHNPGNVISPNMDKLAASGVKLSRHYVFRWCAPTRSALMTGRLPYHVFQSGNYVSREMIMLPAKLKQVGYATHQVGKWHLGLLYSWMTPVGRGFDTSFGYLAGGEDHFTQFQKNPKTFGCVGVDLYNSTSPAYRRNGTYGTYLYNAEIQRVIREHDVTKPLFMYIALQVMHAPQEVPESFSKMYPSPKYDNDYAIMNGMATAADQVLGNTTSALEMKGLWANTLFIYTSDNGGPAGQLSSGHSGNNWPLRGGKTNNFEGGIRVNAFVAGGFVPKSVGGQTRDGCVGCLCARRSGVPHTRHCWGMYACVARVIVGHKCGWHKHGTSCMFPLQGVSAMRIEQLRVTIPPGTSMAATGIQPCVPWLGLMHTATFQPASPESMAWTCGATLRAMCPSPHVLRS